jgi:hypothetical protein
MIRKLGLGRAFLGCATALLLVPLAACTSLDDEGRTIGQPAQGSDAGDGDGGGGSQSDASINPVDGSVHHDDASAPPSDASTGQDDGGFTSDASASDDDASTPGEDASTPVDDAGSTPVDDAGSMPVDAGSDEDAGDLTDAGDTSDAGNTHELELPLVLDEWYSTRNGYIGDGTIGGIADSQACPTPRPGKARGKCHRLTWTPKENGYGGGWWLYPEGNMGAEQGLLIPQGAKAVRFYAWGLKGGESAEFGVGMIGADGFKRVLPEVTLDSTPTEYTIDVSTATYSDVIGGFAFLLGGSSVPVTIFIDDLRWE